jgi:TonB family protein
MLPVFVRLEDLFATIHSLQRGPFPHRASVDTFGECRWLAGARVQDLQWSKPMDSPGGTSVMRCETLSPQLFLMLPGMRPPWKHLALSLVTQSGTVAALLAIAALAPGWTVRTRRDSPAHKVLSQGLIAGAIRLTMAPSFPVSPASPGPPAHLAPQTIPIRSGTSTRPRATPQARDAPATPKLELAAQPMPPLLPAPAILPKPWIQANVFSNGIAEARPRPSTGKSVETGDFGNPGKLEARSSRGKAVAIARLEGFDPASGSGPGRSVVGQPALPGSFAAEAVVRSEAPLDSRALVHPAGFGVAETENRTAAKAQPGEIARTLPAEIISKPVPVYPEEARRLGIEGEVWLEVRFESTGRLQVVRVVRGLGHGLDEAAIQAAQQIRFKPARRDGQPADSTGVLHISFQIA